MLSEQATAYRLVPGWVPADGAIDMGETVPGETLTGLRRVANS